MASNRWKTTTDNADAVLLHYGVAPNESNSQVLIRAWNGIDVTAADSLKASLDATTSVTDPVADNQTYTGTWRVSKNEIIREMGGTLAGSCRIVQQLGYGFFTACMSAANQRIVRVRAYPFEQNENAWMYYELMIKEETLKWVNLSYATAVSEFEYLWYVHGDLPTGASDMANMREHTIYLPTTSPIAQYQLYYPGYTVGYRTNQCLAGTYYRVSASAEGGSTYYPHISDTPLTNVVIESCWYEEEQDGSYTMFRTLKTLSGTTLTKRNRVLQYAGLTRVLGTVTEDDTSITIYGFNDTSITVYQHSKFRIGSDVYRVTTSANASSGQVTLAITPPITLATEEYVDACDTNEAEVFFDALY